nr:Mut7-C RNAse domain-containing protein [Halomarina salina]
MLDVMCGGLRSYLRMCGHDTVYALDRDDEREAAASECEAAASKREAAASNNDALLERSEGEDRTLVTRNVQLAGRASASMLLRERDVVHQLGELHEAGVDLTLDETPTYCGSCNGLLERVAPEEPTAEYAPDPRDERVWRCVDCGQQFWRGSHWDSVRETLDVVRAS